MKLSLDQIKTKYTILENGRIYRTKNNREVKQIKDKDGYLQVRLSVNNIQQTVKMHRLVAKIYIPNPNNNPQVNHKNENKSDNRIENLEWVTAKQNVMHSRQKIYHDSIKHRMKPVMQFSLKGSFIKEYESVNSAAKIVGASGSHIAYCCNNVHSKCKGYIWKWKIDNNHA